MRPTGTHTVILYYINFKLVTKSVILYNYHLCKSVIWRIVSQWRKIKSPECRINFRGKQSVISHSYKVDNCFITSNILHSAIIIWSSSNLTTDTKWCPIFSKFCQACHTWTRVFLRAVWYNHATFTSNNWSNGMSKCHVTFFKLIKFKTSIWVCNKSL